MAKTNVFYVANWGDDNKEGTVESPFRSLARSQQAVRQRINGGMTSDLTVYLHGGSYELADTLRFDDRDSGRNGFRVIYRNVPSETPTVIGGKAIIGWEPYRDGIWVAKVESGSSFRTLYAGAARIVQARLPATGYYETALEGEAGSEGIICRDGDIPDDTDWSRAQAYVWPGEGEWNWFSETIDIDSYDPASRRISFKGESTWEIGRGSRYYVQGSLGTLR